jgi:hypothetical protein
MNSDHTKQERTSRNLDLERIEENIDVELAVVESSHPLDPTATYNAFDPNDPLASDPTDVQRYEVGLSGLREAVLAVERLEDGPA